MSAENLPKLRWACRRGMLELDILLGSYLEEVYLTLSEENQAEFVRLLQFNDQELFDWLTGKTAPTDAGVTIVVQRIRQHAQDRHKD